MSAGDSLLYIDANKYLDLYRTDKGKKLLGPLAEQVEHIFVTQQTVNEVQRNKILVAATFLAEKCKTLKLQTFNIPDHLSGASEGQGRQILDGMSEVVARTKEVNRKVDDLVKGILEQVCRSEDEVSVSLAPIFARAVAHSPEELRRARERRELGNPPGKITNAIGDQLTWEQILTHFKGKKRLWIISRDGDYGTVYGGRGFVNRLLLDELCTVSPNSEAFLFTDLVEGIRHFVETTGAKAEIRLTPAEAAEIEQEEQNLPPAYSANIAELIKASQPNFGGQDVMAEVMRAMKPSFGIQESIADLLKAAQPSLGVQDAMTEVMRAMKPSFGIQESTADLVKAAQTSLGVQDVMTEAIKATKPHVKSTHESHVDRRVDTNKECVADVDQDNSSEDDNAS